MVRRWVGTERVRVLSVAAVMAVFVAGILTAILSDPGAGDRADAVAPSTTSTSTTAPSAPTSTTAVVTPASPSTEAAPTTAPPPATPTAPPPVGASTVGERFTMEPYLGLGAWIDVFDWSWSFTEGRPHVTPADVDRMASLGVRTLFVQVSRYDHPADIVDQDLLDPIIARAGELGMRVVGWYLPTLTDVEADVRRTMAMASLPLDGIGIDIESRDVIDVGERNARLVAYSAAVREALPGEVISAIVLPPVVMEEVNSNYWPGFPWADIAPYYDVWQTMGYWTNRRSDSGWRDGYAYTAANIDRVRAHIGRPDAPVHPIGGIGDRTTVEQLAGMVEAAAERDVIGGSIYDYRTTHDALWDVLQAFNG